MLDIQSYEPSDLLKTIIHNRITDEELKEYYGNDIRNFIFLNYDYKDIINSMDKIEEVVKAADIIREVIEKKGTIAISTDFDCDGIPSLRTVLDMLNCDTFYGSKPKDIYLVVGGRRYGRGLCKHVTDKILKLKNKIKKDIDLLITVDHGSTDEISYKRIKESYPNIKIIVTDHHTIEKEGYPISADVFINFQRKELNFDNTLCGHATIFAVLLYFLFKKPGKNTCDYLNSDFQKLDNVLPYVAISTIGDVMSLKRPFNRFIVSKGLNCWNINNIGNKDERLEFIKKSLDLGARVPNVKGEYSNNREHDGMVDYREIAFSVAPLINTGNRMNKEHVAAIAMASTNYQTYCNSILELIELNKERKRISSRIISDILENINVTNDTYGIILLLDNPTAMINGSIAGNIGSMFNKPTICFNKFGDNNILNGSGRSCIKDLNALEVIRDIEKDNKNIIIAANGHAAAFGISIYEHKLNEFKELFNKYCKKYIDKLPPYQPPAVDKELDFHYITIEEAANDISMLEPYGEGFRPPIFLSKKVTLVKTDAIKTFYKLKFASATANYETETNKIHTEYEAFMYFSNPNTHNVTFLNFKQYFPIGSVVDIKYNIIRSRYRGQIRLMLEIIDIIPHEGVKDG